MKRILAVIASGAMLSVSASALAASSDFGKVDANADGKITFEEGVVVHTDWTDVKFKEVDTNADGSLTEMEYNAAISASTMDKSANAGTVIKFRDIDSNADGMITFEEGKVKYSDWTDEQFKTFDADADGSLTQAEYDAAVSGRMATDTTNESGSTQMTETQSDDTVSSMENKTTMRKTGPAAYKDKYAEGEVLASTLIGMRVYAVDRDIDESQFYTTDARKDWDDIGEVNDVVLDWNGNIKAVVLGVGGFLGLGEKDVAVEMSSIRKVRERDDADDWFLVVNSSKSALENAPTFRR
ncbi:MAG: hypothetical protein HKN11_16745 [Rhizobiales bacterium]|nr:hypothetical protein [Hyphomicrobiales bacterium]